MQQFDFIAAPQLLSVAKILNVYNLMMDFGPARLCSQGTPSFLQVLQEFKAWRPNTDRRLLHGTCGALWDCVLYLRVGTFASAWCVRLADACTLCLPKPIRSCGCEFENSCENPYICMLQNRMRRAASPRDEGILMGVRSSKELFCLDGFCLVVASLPLFINGRRSSAVSKPPRR